MLSTLLIGISSMALIGGAAAAPRTVNGGARDYVLAAVSSLLLMAANAWTWSRTGHAVDDYVSSLSDLRRERKATARRPRACFAQRSARHTVCLGQFLIRPRVSMMSKPLFWSFASGFAWSAVAAAIAYSVAPIHTAPLEATRTLAGGIVAAPVIGLLIGYITRRFWYVSRPRRIGLALADLYFATYLFLLASGIEHLVNNPIGRGQVKTLQRALIIDPFLGTLLGLTYTGFVVVLLPLSYVNHSLIAKAWNQPLPDRQTGG